MFCFCKWVFSQMLMLLVVFELCAVNGISINRLQHLSENLHCRNCICLKSVVPIWNPMYYCIYVYIFLPALLYWPDSEPYSTYLSRYEKKSAAQLKSKVWRVRHMEKCSGLSIVFVYDRLNEVFIVCSLTGHVRVPLEPLSSPVVYSAVRLCCFWVQ